MQKKKKAASYKVGSMSEAFDTIERMVGAGKTILASDLYNSGPRVSSGSYTLDVAMGGGFVIGSTHIFWGDKSAGKTTQAYAAVASFQQHFPDKYCVYVAAEQFSAVNAETNGVDLSRLALVFGDAGEEALNMAEIHLRTGKVALLVIDSVDALVPRAELEGSMDDQQRGAQPRMINKFLRKAYSAMHPFRDEATGKLSYENCPTLLFINQMRVNQNATMFTSPEMMGGGKGISHASKITVRFGERMKSHFIQKELKSKSVPAGVVKAARCIKNNTYPPDITADYSYYFAPYTITKYNKKRTFLPGFIDHAEEIIDVAYENGVLAGDIGRKVTWKGEDYNKHALAILLDENPKEVFDMVKMTVAKVEPALPKSLAKCYADKMKKMKAQRQAYLAQKSEEKKTVKNA